MIAPISRSFFKSIPSLNIPPKTQKPRSVRSSSYSISMWITSSRKFSSSAGSSVTGYSAITGSVADGSVTGNSVTGREAVSCETLPPPPNLIRNSSLLCSFIYSSCTRHSTCSSAKFSSYTSSTFLKKAWEGKNTI